MLGKYGLAAEQLSMQKTAVRRQNYSVSLISAISQHEIVANQLIEGGVDSTVCENFIKHMLLRIRHDPKFEGRNVILLLDNARIHHHSNFLETARAMKVNVVFNAEYSPWLNPVESLFGHIKRKAKEVEVVTR